MLSVSLPAWTHATHPIVHYETRRWRRSRLQRLIQRGPWAVALIVLALSALCAGAVTLQGQLSARPASVILAAGGTLALIAAAVSGLANWLVGLAASILAATLIARERESRTWPFLRLTSLTSAEIVGGKFAAVWYTLRGVLHFVAGLRLLALGVGLLTAVLWLLTERPAAGQVLAALSSLPLTPADLAWLSLLGGVGAAIGLAGWLLEPYFGLLYNGAVGLAASTLARSSGAAVVLMIAAHFGLSLGVYFPAQQIVSLSLLALVSNASNVGVLLPLSSFVIQFGLNTALQLGAALGCALFTLYQVERLSE